MDTLLDIGVWILRLIPLILLLYIPALLGMATWRERGEGYRIKALLWFAIGFGLIVALHVMMSGASAVQIAGVIGLSLVQAAIALGLARLTVYRLAD
jgi:hypothetical protein